MHKYPLTINGRPVAGSQQITIINPATEQIVATCPQGTIALLEDAIDAARRALPGWSALRDPERVASLNAIADLIEQNSTELSSLITAEQGKTQSGPGANLEVHGCAAWTRATAGLVLASQVVQDDAKGYIAIHRKAVGVVGSITPWNWPLMIATWHIMPALRVGCTVVLKPSPYTPLSTLRLVELMNSVLPPGVINVVTGDTEVGNHMVEHAGIDKIVFTGSTQTGRQVMRSSAATLKRLTLELGGNDAGILLPGTDFAARLEGLFWGCFINAGQTCAALKRLYVHESQYEEFITQFAEFVGGVSVGNGADPHNLVGPLSNSMQLGKVRHFVDDARAKGARVISGQPVPHVGYFHPLTIIADATDDMLVVQEEQFGPVIPILKYSTVDEAIRRANSLDVGLGGSVWGDDASACSEIGSRLECGTVWINQHGVPHPLAPFGGVKQSGIGVEFNVDGLKEYTTIQVVNVLR